MERTTSEAVLTQLMSEKNFPVYLYEIELVDRGIATFSGTTGTDSTKRWIAHEWQVSSASLVDNNNTVFEVDDNTTTTVTVLSGSPKSGEFSLHRWFYLTSHVDTLNTDTGVLLPIEFGVEPLNALPKYYLPYPISHQILSDYELGQFPTVQLGLMNPGVTLLEDYYELKAYDLNFYSHFERYNALRGNRVNIIIIFLDENGDVITPATVKLANQFVVNTSVVTKNQITLTLSSLGSLSQRKIPSRTFSKITCDCRYGGERCGYTKNVEFASPIPKCNKLFRSFVLGTQTTRVIYNESGNSYYLPDIVISEWTADEEAQINGSIIENTQSNYLWRVENAGLAGGTLYFTAESYDPQLDLHDYLSGGEGYISLLDKECCMGHNDSGWKNIYNPFTGSSSTNPACRPNDLIFNGDFGGYSNVFSGASAAWSITDTSAFSAQGGFLFADTRGITNMPRWIYQTVYDIDQTQHGVTLQKGKQLAFILKYYGWSAVDDGQPAAMGYEIGVTTDGGNFRSWNATSKTWASGRYINSVPLREYSYRLCGNSDTPNIDSLNYIKCDTFTDRIYMTPSGTYKEMVVLLYFGKNGSWDNSQCSFVAVKDVSLQLYNQSERFGAFPAIPTSRFWYF